VATRVFIGNLAVAVSDQELSALFAAYGKVLKAEVVRSRGGRGRGFGFVELSSETEAAQAIRELNGRELQGKALTVSPASSTAPRRFGRESDYGGFSEGRHSAGEGRWNRRF
jgi:RNA recognition motif-containing protein